MRPIALASLCFFLMLAAAVPAQSCSGGAALMTNDNLPANLAWPFLSRPISSLGAGDAAACVFDVSGIAPVVHVDSAAVAFVDGLGGNNGLQAPANLAIYDGLSWNGNLPILGPKVFDYGLATGNAITVTASGITVTSLAGFDVQVASGKLVVAWTILVGNLGSRNFATDGTTNTGFSCSPVVTPPMKNLLYRNGIGWYDCTAAPASNGLPFCPFAYSGNWIIRACALPASFLDAISIAGSPIHSPGTGAVTFTFPSHPGMSYLGGAAFATTPGIPTSIGVVPLADDALLAFSLAAPSVFAGFGGLLDPLGTATGSIVVPPGIAPGSFFIAAVSYDAASGQLLGITNAAPVSVW